ncbi:myelin-associated glycoprotein-like [Osmerus mordax]|uniref:myelin-associated glycoprotein-like n=1 Tax=Osmerus mordax TaxID=8014 RepID=UPI003510D127
MTAAVRLLIVFILQGVLCQEWAVFLPQSVEALSGSCVIIPCSFHLFTGYHSYLNPSCKGIWRRGWNRVQVYDSSVTNTENTIQGNLTGNLVQKDCTTILNNFPSHLQDDYYFRLECDNALKFNFATSVSIKTRDTPAKPSLTPGRVEVLEGTPVSLSCSAAAPCPSLPPTLTWTPRLGDTQENLQENQDNLMTSILTFTASYLHNGQKVSCTALYKRQDGNRDLSTDRSLFVTVLYSPMNTSVSVSPSTSILEGSFVTLTCNSDANPAVKSFNWYRADGNLGISVGSRKKLTTQVSEENRHFYCETRNEHGAENSSVIELDVQYPPKNISVSISPSDSEIEGSSVILTCISDANPEVKNYTWYRVNGDENIIQLGQSFIIDRVDSSHSGEYYCEALNEHGLKKSSSVKLDIEYPPRNTSVSVSPSGSVVEGSSVTLTCSSDANPAVQNFTWYRVNGWKKKIWEFGPDLTFNVTKLSSEQFYCEALNDHGVEYSEAISVDVTFAPEILPSSRCIRTTQHIRCYCESQGNPLPVMEWQLDGESANQSNELSIKEKTLGFAKLRSSLTVRQSLEYTPTLVCLSNNSIGFDNLALNVSSVATQIWTDFHTFSILIGAAAGSLAMMILCVFIHLSHCKRHCQKLPQQRPEDTAVTNKIFTQEEDVVHENQPILAGLLGEDRDGEGDLHYADVDTKFQSRVGVVSSKTSEYTAISQRSRSGSRVEEKGEIEASLNQGTKGAGPVPAEYEVQQLQGGTVSQHTDAQQGHSKQDSPPKTGVDYLSQLTTEQQLCDGEVMNGSSSDHS